jgi:hypothetical protein
LNRVVDDRIAIGIARITRQPIRTRVASRDHRVDRSARKRAPKGAHDDDWMIDVADA